MPVSDAIDPNSRLAYLWSDPSPQATIDFINEFLYVGDERGAVHKFTPNAQQVRILQEETGRDLTVKARQTGTSTIKLARRFRRMINGELNSANALIAADKDGSTQKFREKFLQWFKDIKHRGFDFKFAAESATELVIEGFNNRFIWASGESSHIARSYSAQEVHLSEFAHWKDANAGELVGEMLPAVPPPPFGNADLESTPAGDEGQFYDLAMGAHTINGLLHDPKGEWDVHFYPWWLDIRYRLAVTGSNVYADIYLSQPEYDDMRRSFKPDAHEATLIPQMREDVPGVTEDEIVDKILWRRIKKVRQDRTPVPFLQEFPESFETCWLGVQGRYFDTPDGEDHVSFYRGMVTPPKLYLTSLPYRGSDINFFGPNLAVFEAPRPGAVYVVSGDAAGGGIDNKSDPTCLVVWDAHKSKVVARATLRCSPKHAGLISAALGVYYNEALVTWERSQHGETALDELKENEYGNIYAHMDLSKPNEKPRPGIFPTQHNRESALENFKHDITYHIPVIEDAMGTQQMSQFTWERAGVVLKAQARKGQHDDWILAAAWGYWILQTARTRRRRQVREDRHGSVSSDEEMVVGSNGRVVSRGARNRGFYYNRGRR